MLFTFFRLILFAEVNQVKAKHKVFQKLEAHDWLSLAHSSTAVCCGLVYSLIFSLFGMCQELWWDTTLTFLMSRYSQISWKKQRCEQSDSVEAAKWHTLPGDAFCLKVILTFIAVIKIL